MLRPDIRDFVVDKAQRLFADGQAVAVLCKLDDLLSTPTGAGRVHAAALELLYKTCDAADPLSQQQPQDLSFLLQKLPDSDNLLLHTAAILCDRETAERARDNPEVFRRAVRERYPNLELPSLQNVFDLST